MSVRALVAWNFGSRFAAVLCGSLLAAGMVVLDAGPAAAASSPVMRAGKLAGPIAIHGGNELRTVASLPLGRGNWTVYAKGVIRNTTTNPLARDARCQLKIGRTSDDVRASPFRRSAGGSRLPFLLTHSAHLSASGQARLRCAAPGSRTGAIVVDRIRMVGFRTASLFVRQEGRSGTFYGNVETASQVRHLIGNNGLVADDLERMATLPLPVGRWVVTGTATIQHTAPDGPPGLVYCIMGAGADGGIAFGIVRPVGQSRVPIAIELVHASGSAFDAALSCVDASSSGRILLRDIRLTAYRLRALANQPLEPGQGFAFGPFPARIKPVAYAGYDDGPVRIPRTSTYLTMNSLTLPAARYVVVATAVMLDSGVGAPVVACRLGYGRSFDTVNIRLAAGPVGPSYIHSFALIWSGGFADARKVRLQCRTDGTVDLQSIRIVAYRAGTLVNLPLD